MGATLLRKDLIAYMPRKARAKSSTGIYHCILRGVDKRDIFLDNQDRYKFINEIRNTKEKYNYELYAYCLMDNHVHLLIKENDNELHKLMHDLVLRYSMYFNTKYERVGHLFQNRYLSKTVETERYLLTLQRYIHQNPKYMETYQWSSYKEYIGRRNDIVNIDVVLNLFSENKKIAIEEFKEFTTKRLQKMSIKEYKDYEITDKISDEEAIERIKVILELDNILSIKKYNTEIRNEYIRNILNIEGVTISQLSRIIEMDKKTIAVIKNATKNIVTPVPNVGKNQRWETSPKEEKNG